MAPTFLSKRNKRFYNKLSDDQRNPSRRDRDRILYSSAFLRLNGITQVVSPTERRICHNRLTHSLKVAQVARRLAEYLLEQYPTSKIQTIGGIDPDVVESAGLAHDLGHPPFGHASEKALQECLITKCPKSESFEGNAQSFRVVNRLAVRSLDFDGLDLSCATLNALLKYPWNWHHPKRKQSNKWGAYSSEGEIFHWAREPLPKDERAEKTIEAEIMDLADELSYAVHDMEDFYRAGLIPLYRLTREEKLTDEGERFVEGVFNRWRKELPLPEELLRERFVLALRSGPIAEPFHGLRGERAALKAFSSGLISQYILSTKIDFASPPGHRITISDKYRAEIYMLQKLTWHYVILNPMLTTQQFGQKKLIKSLFDFYFTAANSQNDDLLPQRAREVLEKEKRTDELCSRMAADIISGMTELEVQHVAHRILGISLGSAFDETI